MLDEIDMAAEDEHNDWEELIFPTLKTFFNENVDNGLSNAIEWLYPDGVYDPTVAINNTILSATNEEGNMCNINVYICLYI